MCQGSNKTPGCNIFHCKPTGSQWPRGLRRRSAAARLLRSWVRIPPGAWMLVCCECCVLLGRGLCDELITRLEESYRMWCVVVCDIETSRIRRPWPALGNSTIYIYIYICIYIFQYVSAANDRVTTVKRVTQSDITSKLGNNVQWFFKYLFWIKILILRKSVL